jgi:hypothetical protein
MDTFEEDSKLFSLQKEIFARITDGRLSHEKVLEVFQGLVKTDRTLRSLQDLYCSFCYKNSGDVEILIAGPGVYICSECVGVCIERIAEKRKNGGGGK